MPAITGWKPVDAERAPAHRLRTLLTFGPDPIPPPLAGARWAQLAFIPAALDTMREAMTDAGLPQSRKRVAGLVWSRKPRTSLAALVLHTVDDDLVNLELLCRSIARGEPCSDEQIDAAYPGLAARLETALGRLAALAETLAPVGPRLPA